MKYKNQKSEKIEIVTDTFVWTLLFGPIYFLSKGMLFQFVLSLLLLIITFGASWFIYPFFAKNLVHNYYLNNNWIELKDEQQDKLKVSDYSSCCRVVIDEN